jgi:hypothetical protein
LSRLGKPNEMVISITYETKSGTIKKASNQSLSQLKVTTINGNESRGKHAFMSYVLLFCNHVLFNCWSIEIV